MIGSWCRWWHNTAPRRKRKLALVGTCTLVLLAFVVRTCVTLLHSNSDVDSTGCPVSEHRVFGGGPPQANALQHGRHF